MENNIKKVKLKNILKTSNVENDRLYEWDKLYKSLRDNGYDIKNHKPMNVIPIYKDYFLIFDGHHRLVALKKIYGEDYEINVITTNILKYNLFIYFISIYTTIVFIFKFIYIFFKYHIGKLVK